MMPFPSLLADVDGAVSDSLSSEKIIAIISLNFNSRIEKTFCQRKWRGQEYCAENIREAQD